MALKELLPVVLEFLGGIVEKYGTKFLVALAAFGCMTYFGVEVLQGEFSPDIQKWTVIIAPIAMAAVAVAYFIARRQQEKDSKPTETETTKP